MKKILFQIDLESPHMDPAVVMVHPPKRPPLQVKFVTIICKQIEGGSKLLMSLFRW